MSRDFGSGQNLGWVCEIFASIQGEGIVCGQRQTFIRLAGCNLSCQYCDTFATREPKPESCRVELTPGSGMFRDLPNPLDVSSVVDFCTKMRSQWIALTGGEPLCQAEFLKNLLPRLRANGFSVYLETNGTLYEELAQVIVDVDVVAMDIKLQSATGIKTPWNIHKRFLEVASQKNVFVKAVVSNSTTCNEIAYCARVIADIDRDIPFVIQPVTGDEQLTGLYLMQLQEAAEEYLSDVRVIPQMHKMLGIL